MTYRESRGRSPVFTLPESMFIKSVSNGVVAGSVLGWSIRRVRATSAQVSISDRPDPKGLAAHGYGARWIMTIICMTSWNQSDTLNFRVRKLAYVFASLFSQEVIGNDNR